MLVINAMIHLSGPDVFITNINDNRGSAQCCSISETSMAASRCLIVLCSLCTQCRMGQSLSAAVRTPTTALRYWCFARFYLASEKGLGQWRDLHVMHVVFDVHNVHNNKGSFLVVTRVTDAADITCSGAGYAQEVKWTRGVKETKLQSKTGNIQKTMWRQEGSHSAWNETK